MMNPKSAPNLRNLLPFMHRILISRFSSSPFVCHHNQHRFQRFQFRTFILQYLNPLLPFSVFRFHQFSYLHPKISPSFNLSFASRPQYSVTTTNASSYNTDSEKAQELVDSNGEVKPIDLLEEENEAKHEIEYGGHGGGVVLHHCSWGEKALSIAQDVLLQYGDDIQIFAFKISPRGYIYVRLDRLCDEFLSMEDIQSYSHEYMRKLAEAGAAGDIPSDLALEVSSPDADRLLRIPNDLQRFKNMAMRVKYVERDDPKSMKKEGVFFLESIEMDSGSCVWRLADVKENRGRSSKGRPLTRKQKDWRLKLPYEMLEQVTLYLDYK